MSRAIVPIHGSDHCPGGPDPIPCLGGSGEAPEAPFYYAQMFYGSVSIPAYDVGTGTIHIPPLTVASSSISADAVADNAIERIPNPGSYTDTAGAVAPCLDINSSGIWAVKCSWAYTGTLTAGVYRGGVSRTGIGKIADIANFDVLWRNDETTIASPYVYNPWPNIVDINTFPFAGNGFFFSTIHSEAAAKTLSFAKFEIWKIGDA